MGGTLSCGGKVHRPVGDDNVPYGAPVSKPIGIVQPQEKVIVIETTGKYIFYTHSFSLTMYVCLSCLSVTFDAYIHVEI